MHLLANEPIRIGIAGLGRSGWSMHADALSKIPELFAVTAVMEPDPERRAEAKARFACEAFDSYDDLLKADLELIVIATPSHFHVEHTVKALEASKHVIVEKPMAQTAGEADQMIAAAKKAGKLLTVNQNYRYKSATQKVSEVIASGKLGELVQIRVVVHGFSRRWDWQTLKRLNGGILNNHGAHYLDWSLQFISDEEPDLFCHMVNTSLYAGDAESHAKLVLRPKQGPLLDMELTHHNAYPQATWLVMGTQGTLTGTQQRLEWKYVNPADMPPLVLDLKPTPDRSYNREDMPWQEAAASFDDPPNTDMLRLYQDLYKTLRQDQALAITPESVRRQIRIFERCREQVLEKGTRIP